MDSFKFHYEKAEKANAISKHQRITTLFRFLELFIFIIILSRVSTQFPFSLSLSGEYFRGISVTLISPRSVFLVGNAIVVALFLISGQKKVDFYDEYAEKCQYNKFDKDEKKTSEVCEGVGYYEKKKKKKKMSRCKSENLVREARGRDLRRSVSEKCRKREDEMSGEEFRRTVEAFIARQQRFLREEEEEEEGFSAVVSV